MTRQKSQHGVSLSLLSRGVGDLKREITNLVHEKVDVHLEPQDYYNLNDHAFATDEALKDKLVDQDGALVAHVPKTFTTRRGALLLFSEDLGTSHRIHNRHPKRLRNRRSRNNHSILGMVDFAISEEATEEDAEEENEEGLRTVDDLTRSILSYGSREPDDVHLRFVHPRRPTKIVRPGFSARRYLSNLTSHFDPTFVDKMLASGRLSEKTLFQQSAFMPHIRRRIKDDLSLYPPPYRIMKQMLLAPGPLNEFSFFWKRREKTESSISVHEDVEMLEEGDICLIERDKAMAGIGSREVSYAELDSSTQRSVLSNLLVKSAINHAIRRQEELEIKPLTRLSENQEELGPPGMFDMMTAVKTLLDTETERDILPPVHTGFRGRALRGRPTESTTSSSRITPLPVTSRAVSQSVSRTTSPPGSTTRRSQDVHLPPMSQLPLVSMPINEGMEEYGRHDVPIVNLTIDGGEEELEEKEAESDVTVTSHQTSGPAVATLGFMVPQFTTHLQPRVPSRMRKTPVRLRPLSPRPEEKEEPPAHVGKVTITFQGNTVSPGPITVQHPQMALDHEKKKTKPSWKRLKDQDLARGREDGELEFTSRRGVIGRHGISEKVYGYPVEHGEKRRHEISRKDSGSSVGGRRDEGPGAGGGPTPFTSDDLMELLTGHADRVAERVLSNNDGGVDLAKDVKAAIQHIVMQREQEMGGQGDAEDRPPSNISQDEYKDMIKEALRSVVAQTAPGIEIPPDMELSDEVLARLTSSEGLLADELVITTDPETGNSVLRLGRPSIVDGSRTHVVSRPKYEEDEGDEKESSSKVREISLQSNLSSVSSVTMAGNPVIRSRITSMADTRSALNFGPAIASDALLEEHVPGSGLSSSIGSSVGGSSSLAGPAGRAQGRGVSRRLFEAGKDKASAVARTMGTAPTTISEERTGISGRAPPGETVGADEGHEGHDERSEDRAGSQGSPAESPSIVKEKSSVSRVSGPGLGDRKKTLDREEFVVGKVPDKEELQRLYGQPPGAPPREGEGTQLSTSSGFSKPKKPPVPKASEAKKKKSKSKKKKQSISKGERRMSKKEETAKSIPKTESISGEGSAKAASELSEDYHLVDDEFSDDEFENETQEGTPVYPRRRYYPVPRPKESTEPEEDEEEARLRKLSLREQREARRRADAEKRRAEMERRRLEREQKKRMELEEAEKQRLMEAEFEEERHRREEEFRLRKQREREERDREGEAIYQAELARQRQREREQREREELQRRMEEMRRFHEEEEERKRLEEEQRRKDEEIRRQEEREMLALMAEEERLEYERKKREEEEQRKKEEEEARKRREEEARIAMEEARRLAEEMARQKAAHEARQRFLKGLHLEFMGLQRSSRITKPHVWSYFDLLQWLGLELPEFEGKKGR